MDKFRIMVVDDSPFMRKAIERMLSSAPDIEVVATARDGQEALDKLAEVKPDLITLDVEMPRMDGLTCLRKIMATQPTPVLMVSALTQEGAKATLDALAAGALDFIPKESGTGGPAFLQLQNELQEKIRKLARNPRFGRNRPAPALRPAPGGPAATITPRPTGKPSSLPSGSMADLLVIGTSTGGPKALQELLPLLPASLPVPCLIVQHMPATFTKAFADRLNGLCQVTVKEAEHGEPTRSGHVYIAPGGQHMFWRPKGSQGHLELGAEPASTLHRPSVDVMFNSVAEAYPRQVLAMILTGMGSDGAKGMEALKQKGAFTVAEAEETCVVYGMPRAAFERGCVDVVSPLGELAPLLRGHFKV